MNFEHVFVCFLMFSFENANYQSLVHSGLNASPSFLVFLCIYIFQLQARSSTRTKVLPELRLLLVGLCLQLPLGLN